MKARSSMWKLSKRAAVPFMQRCLNRVNSDLRKLHFRGLNSFLDKSNMLEKPNNGDCRARMKVNNDSKKQFLISKPQVKSKYKNVQYIFPSIISKKKIAIKTRFKFNFYTYYIIRCCTQSTHSS